LAVVLHETDHAYGQENEAHANCDAVQLVYFFARQLNFVPTLALRLAELAVRKVRATAPPGYWDAKRCRDGGARDLIPNYRNLK
jgi:hypothetical protein